MKVIDTQPIKLIHNAKNIQFWLLAIAAGLIAIHFTLTGRDADVSSQSMSVLYWLAVSSLVWEKRHHLSMKSSLLSSLLGLLLIMIVVLRGASLASTNFLSVSPFLSGLGLGLLASGVKGLKQYWRELTILFFFGVPKILLAPFINITTLTAQLTVFILWYGGLDVQRQGTQVLLPVDGVNVVRSCSGFNSIFYLLGLAVIFLLLFPLKGVAKNVLVPIVAIVLAFFVNGCRIALLAIQMNAQNQSAFDYWHEGQGAALFPMIAVTLFGIFCYILRQHELSKHDYSES